MTHHVSHTNKMMFDLKQQYQGRIAQLEQKIIEQMRFELKQQYQGRIAQLEQKIIEQQKEILDLQDMIKLLSYDKEYDV